MQHGKRRNNIETQAAARLRTAMRQITVIRPQLGEWSTRLRSLTETSQLLPFPLGSIDTRRKGMARELDCNRFGTEMREELHAHD
jgi:hypothetical protein